MNTQQKYNDSYSDHSIKPSPSPKAVNLDWDETLILPPPRVKGRGRGAVIDENRYLKLEILSHDLFELTLPSDVEIGDTIDVNNGHGIIKEIVIDDRLVGSHKLVVDFNQIPCRRKDNIAVYATAVVENNYIDTRPKWSCGLCW